MSVQTKPSGPARPAKCHDPYSGSAADEAAPPPAAPDPPVVQTPYDLLTYGGSLSDYARTAAGSSVIQNSLRDPHCSREVLERICADLLPQLSDLLLDCHGCYCLKALLERLPHHDLLAVAEEITHNDELQYSLCTHSLHTRRVTQYLMETIGASFMSSILLQRSDEIATTQQGCIVLQRAIDVADPALRDAIITTIYRFAVPFSVDAFANYAVQYAMQMDSRERVSYHLEAAFRGKVVELSCNKFASNVIEKCLSVFTPEAQHAMLMEMYASPDAVLLHMLHDSFGNYIIQSSIALAPLDDVALMAEKLRAVIPHSPFGHKMEARLERRLGGRAVSRRGSYGPRGEPPHRAPFIRQRGPRRIPIPPEVEETVEESW